MPRQRDDDRSAGQRFQVRFQRDGRIPGIDLRSADVNGERTQVLLLLDRVLDGGPGPGVERKPAGALPLRFGDVARERVVLADEGGIVAGEDFRQHPQLGRGRVAAGRLGDRVAEPQADLELPVFGQGSRPWPDRPEAARPPPEFNPDAGSGPPFDRSGSSAASFGRL